MYNCQVKKMSLVVFQMVLVLLFALPAMAGQKGVDKTIGLFLDLTTPDPAQAAIFQKAFLKEFSAMYGRTVKEIKPPAGVALNKAVDALIFVGAGYGVDHMVGFEGNGEVKFTKKKKRDAKYTMSFKGKAWLVDVAGRQAGLQKDIMVASSGELEDYAPEMFEMAAYQDLAKKIYGDIASVYNPNIMKRLNVREVANYFYDKRDCARAFPLYERAEGNESQFDILDDINKKKAECQSKVKTQERESAGFRFDLKFRKLSEDMQAYFTAAAKAGNFAERFKSHTAKPVSIEIEFKGDAEKPNEGEIVGTVIHDPKRYPLGKNLNIKANQNYLDFKPYQNLMAEFLYFKAMALKQMPEAQQKIFSNYPVRFQLEKTNGDYLTFFIYPDSSGKVAMPTKMFIKVSGFKAIDVEQSGVQTTSTFGLGPAKNIDGAETVYFVIYKFFDVATSP